MFVKATPREHGLNLYCHKCRKERGHVVTFADSIHSYQCTWCGATHESAVVAYWGLSDRKVGIQYNLDPLFVVTMVKGVDFVAECLKEIVEERMGSIPDDWVDLTWMECVRRYGVKKAAHIWKEVKRLQMGNGPSGGDVAGINHPITPAEVSEGVRWRRIWRLFRGKWGSMWLLAGLGMGWLLYFLALLGMKVWPFTVFASWLWPYLWPNSIYITGVVMGIAILMWWKL